MCIGIRICGVHVCVQDIYVLVLEGGGGGGDTGIVYSILASACIAF